MTGAFLDSLQQEVGRFALCWKLTRSDGVVLGFTSHDRDVPLDGLTYLARPGMTPSAVSGRAGFEPDSMEISGALDASQISAFDLDSGRWNGARVELFVCDWSDPASGALRLTRGTIGDISRPVGRVDGTFSVELVSDMIVLAGNGAPLCSPICRSELGDQRCTVDLAGRFRDVAVSNIAADELQIADVLDRPEEFAEGKVRFLDGPLVGIDRKIARIELDSLVLEEPVVPIGPGPFLVRIFEGCDKRFSTCADRFGNALAFDGEPHVPGNDALLRYGDA
jgi:uncharacterized phage protein (TIGR02218 family)